MFKANNMSDTTLSSSPAPKPNREPNPQPDAAIGVRSAQIAQTSHISPADWDELFHAITARLEACSGTARLTHVPEHMLGVTASLQVAVRECAASLQLLHMALVRERQLHQHHQQYQQRHLPK